VINTSETHRKFSTIPAEFPEKRALQCGKPCGKCGKSPQVEKRPNPHAAVFHLWISGWMWKKSAFPKSFLGLCLPDMTTCQAEQHDGKYGASFDLFLHSMKRERQGGWA